MVHVVVIDDVVRFALHVWRYLDRGLAFRIGSVQDGERAHFFADDGKPKERTTADGKAAVWWVPADDFWRNKLEAVRTEISGTTTLYLIDVKSSAGNYSARAVVEWLLNDPKIADEDIFVVSSYTNERVPKFELWPKSPATLQEVARRIRSERNAEPACHSSRVIGAPGCLDVLVTGAGFEYADLPLGFGLPATRDLLLGMGAPFGTLQGDGGQGQPEAEVCLKSAGRGFPVPCNEEFEPLTPTAGENVATPLYRQMVDLAENERLDEWWDLLLETKLRSRLQPPNDLENRRPAKRQVLQLEVEMRNAFRNAILRHDWGYLRQSLAAARLPWCAWLTTNYTRFADRAIALTEEAKRRAARLSASALERGPSGDFDEAPTWRIIATAQEAQLLMRELQDRTEGGADRNRVKGRQAPLFKLHGDISHLQTMAIAGHDKDVYSLLSVPVDSVYQVYNAAEKYLQERVKLGPEKGELRFHVVGHALKDESLVQVLEGIFRASRGWKLRLKLVGPNPPVVPSRLEEFVTEDSVEKTAEEYMASLRTP